MQPTVPLLDLTLTTALTAEISGAPQAMPIGRVESLALHANFDYGSGGTDVKAWVQTSLDGGATWVDIASFVFTTSDAKRMYNLTAAVITAIATPGDGALADNTAVNGFLGALFRVKLTTTGTYTGASSFKIYASPK